MDRVRDTDETLEWDVGTFEILEKGKGGRKAKSLSS